MERERRERRRSLTLAQRLGGNPNSRKSTPDSDMSRWRPFFFRSVTPFQVKIGFGLHHVLLLVSSWMLAFSLQRLAAGRQSKA